MVRKTSRRPSISVFGARQNNLKDFDLELPLNELIVVTGVSGSGKSSLAFDTIYAEGQRRYVETFSAYARQFLDRMDKPQVDKIIGIPPAIAIDQANPVRTSRSTVGTMTELNDHLKLLFARVAHLVCGSCGQRIQRDDPESVYASVQEFVDGQSLEKPAAIVTFKVSVPENFSADEIEGFLSRQGYTRILERNEESLTVVQDRFRLTEANKSRAIEAFESAFRVGRGQLSVRLQEEPELGLSYSSRLHCAQCDLSYSVPIPNSFSFNSPIGACETCRGFGRTMGIDYELVIPNSRLSLADGAIKPLQSKTYKKYQTELLRHATERGIDTSAPWDELSEHDRAFVIEGEGTRRQKKWFGLKRFFAWLESKSYRMHIRVLLAKYRSYETCEACKGARLKPESLLWRIDGRPLHAADLNIHDILQLSLNEVLEFFESFKLPAPLDAALAQLMDEIKLRLRYLNEVGLGYLSLDRQSRSLSGGEVQRINLTTALGTSLVNALFVLDEPSVGLHARDVGRLVGVLQRLRDAGNSLIVVEHDAQVMLAADRILDIGPGPGHLGGEVVFNGTPQSLLRRKNNLTAQYLNGTKVVATVRADADADADAGDGPSINLRGAAQHNLKKVDVAIPLNRFVAVTGVSGSGKSTLVQDTLFNAVARSKGHSAEQPGEYSSLDGADLIDDVVLVDQSSIGKTTRSNPASYVGAFEAIRKVFAAEALSHERGYTAGTFSFNAGNGRCPTCSGNGFERIEMQFLSDVYLRCSACNGSRFRSEILEVCYTPDAAQQPLSIAQVLELTVTEAVNFFSESVEIKTRLAPLIAVGLGYMTLGQSVPTLSGGEAQRLKLAGYIAKARMRRRGDAEHLLFLFDEPTTGLHFADVAKLIGALRELLDAGHSVVVIEHNLDLIAASDWVIDLGPEGGDAGGEIVATGTPQEMAKLGHGHTAAALRIQLSGHPNVIEAYQSKSERASDKRVGVSESASRPRHKTITKPQIEIIRAREHNLKGIDVTLPRDKITAITGVSGSGKSTIAFDILFAEGQRRYLESLNAYARQYAAPAARPDIDAVRGIPPTVAIEQRTSRGGRKSTVATVTEIYHYLRLLFVKLGVQYCPECDLPIESQQVDEIVADILERYRGQKIALLSPLIMGRKGYYTDLARWAARKHYSELIVDGQQIPTDAWPRLDRFKDHNIDLPVAEIQVGPEQHAAIESFVRIALGHGRGMVRVAKLGRRQVKSVRLYSTERSCPKCARSFEPLDPRLFSFNSRYGWCNTCFGTGQVIEDFDAEVTGEEARWLSTEDEADVPCPDCSGRRLRAEAIAVRLRGRSIAEFTAFSIDSAEDYMQKIDFRGRDAEIAVDILPELLSRLRFLKHVGLGYLSLDRAAPTLSGGESQRIRLAAQLGSNLRGVCYVLDEPTIGLHARDNAQLLDTLDELACRGNTVVVVEHDEDTIRRADHIVDIGPGAGRLGGELVVSGSLKKLLAASKSITGRVLANPPQHPMFIRRRPDKTQMLSIQEATQNNLQKLSVDIPLGLFVAVSGVSGSGKSTLIRSVLVGNLKHRIGQNARKAKLGNYKGCKKIEGWDGFDRLLEVDQTPIGKTPRSCPATYVGIWSEIRQIFAGTTEARLRGYSAARFSFNVSGGRCEVCEGQGVRRISMSFLADVSVLCERCHGKRFAGETLDVRFKDRTIADVLSMSVDEAAEFFSAHRKIHHTLSLLADVGLGYLSLGQPSPTLSGGEAQRVKLVTELARGRSAGKALYVLDEPTIGLHIADIEKLLRVIQRLIEAGNSVIVIEHNLDVLAEADWILDMGPEGGTGGGKLVAKGSPEQLIKRKRHSHTTRALAKFLDR